MNRLLVENNYIIIPNFISSYRSNKLKEDFSKFAKENNLGGDPQAFNSSAYHNYISFLELLCEKTPEVSEILEETVLPTYTYSRIYKKGSILEKHTDRDACEISLTLHLGGDSSWPIWIKTPSGEDKAINLNPGDAMMYFGCDAEHWRNEYGGEEYVQVFLHYVRSRGDKFNSYFDRDNEFYRMDQKSTLEENKPTIEDNKQNTIITENKIEDEYHGGDESKNVFSTSKLEDFIQVYENIVPEDLCDTILKEYVNSNEWGSSATATGINKTIRNCNEIQMSDPLTISVNYDIRKEIDDNMCNSVRNCILKYAEKYPSASISNDSGYTMLKYEKGEFYTQHTDSFTERPRELSVSLLLNDDYVGGEFAFFNRDVMIRSGKGSAIIFPSNFLYPHEIMPVLEGTRYSIITWLL
jgi:predicted 2-oxoglutarate/Fe(II)-dependent dioxygenase YbiX